jgi:HAD superfamily hydrolase (TIGR01509 family)
MRKPPIKLLIVDYYGVMTTGSYKDTCAWIAKKYNLVYEEVYKLVYHKYFNMAALGKISEKDSFELPARKLNLEETWKELRKKHLSFQKLNQPVFNLIRKLQAQGYKVLLLSKNTRPQFNYNLKLFKTRLYFKNIINTLDLKLPKSSKKIMLVVLKRFNVKPEEVVFIDDQDFNLVEAKKMGVNTVLYKGFPKMKKQLMKYLSLS